MTQEEKQLLLQDLCSRLPYGVKIDIPDLFISTKNNIEVLNEIFCGDDGEFRCNASGMLIKYVKPYLYPMSSMTDEEKKEYRKACELDTEILSKHPMDETPFPALYNSQDWLNAHHFDYRGLIPTGAAIDATGKNIY